MKNEHFRHFMADKEKSSKKSGQNNQTYLLICKIHVCAVENIYFSGFKEKKVTFFHSSGQESFFE